MRARPGTACPEQGHLGGPLRRDRHCPVRFHRERHSAVDSDIDVLVTFDGPATVERYFGVQFFLEDLLGRPVDLVTDKALRPELRPFVEKEAVHV